eukprot:7450756-Alexandrium_andersonii.AAC.1
MARASKRRAKWPTDHQHPTPGARMHAFCIARANFTAAVNESIGCALSPQGRGADCRRQRTAKGG